MRNAVKLGSRCLVASFVWLSFATPRVWAVSYTFTSVIYPGDPDLITNLTGINDAGEAIGNAAILYGASVCCTPAAFVYSGGAFTVAFTPAPGAGNFSTGAINNNGAFLATVGSASYEVNGTTVTPVSVPGASSTSAVGINNLGQIVGSYTAANGSHGFFYDGSTFHTLDFPGSSSINLMGINDLGQIVGYTGFLGAAQGFLYQGGSFQTIAVPGASSTMPYAINDLGEIVGTYGDVFNRNGFVDVGGDFSTFSAPPLQPPGGPFQYGTVIEGINNLGEIAGTWQSPVGAVRRGFVGTPVSTAVTPEPATIALVWTGVVGLGALMRIRAARLGSTSC